MINSKERLVISLIEMEISPILSLVGTPLWSWLCDVLERGATHRLRGGEAGTRYESCLDTQTEVNTQHYNNNLTAILHLMRVLIHSTGLQISPRLISACQGCYISRYGLHLKEVILNEVVFHFKTR